MWNMGYRMGDQYVHMVFDADPLTDAPGLSDLDQDARLELESRVFDSTLFTQLHFCTMKFNYYNKKTRIL